jgi:ankyrin repeat protein
MYHQPVFMEADALAERELSITERKARILGLAESGKLNVCDHNGQAPIHRAAMHGRLDEIEAMLLTKRAKLDLPCPKLRTAAHYSGMNDHRDCLAALLRAGASAAVVDKAGFSPLHTACFFNSARCLKASRCARALVFSISLCRPACLQFLVSVGASTSQPTKGGLTPLMLCAEQDAYEVGSRSMLLLC